MRTTHSPTRKQSLAEEGADLVASLRGRGLRLQLGLDGRILVGPRDRLDKSDLYLLATYRAAIAAALETEG